MSPNNPRVFTPFLRRFTDERADDLAATHQLYRDVENAYAKSRIAQPGALPDLAGVIIERILNLADIPNYAPLIEAFDKCHTDIFNQQDVLFTLPELPEYLSLKEKVDLRRFLRAKQHFLANEERVLRLFSDAMINIFGGLGQEIAKLNFAASSATVPLYTLLPNINTVADRIIGTLLAEELQDAGVFTQLQNQLIENVYLASGRPLDKESSKPIITAAASELPPQRLIETYLANTPFLELFAIPVPLSIRESTRFEHTAIVAGTGWGKTQLLQTLILADLKKDDPPSLIVLDSTGQMIDRIQHLAVFNNRLKDRILVIDPAQSPALNMFDLNTPRFQNYTSEEKERVEAEIISLFTYVFSSIDNPLSDPMRTVFSYMVRLILTVPGANITTLRELLQDNPKGGYEASKFKPYMEKLDSTASDFFRLQFFGDRVKGTRESILQRVSSIISIPTFERMFTSVNRIDFFEEMQKGACILVNTSEERLKEGSALFGRYVIARVMAAAFERAAVPDRERKPAFLYVDEAAPYFDDQFEKLLTRLRQYRLGAVIAFQHLEQTSAKLRSALAASTSIKYAGRLGHSDRNWMAHEMETTPEFIQSQQKDIRDPPRWTQFACFALGSTRTAVSLTVPFLTLEAEPRMTIDEHRAMLTRNKARVASPEKPQVPEPRHEQPQMEQPHQVPQQQPPIYPTARPTAAPQSKPDTSESDSKW